MPDQSSPYKMPWEVPQEKPRPLVPESAQQLPKFSSIPPSGKPKGKTWKIIGSGCLVFIIIIVGLVAWGIKESIPSSVPSDKIERASTVLVQDTILYIKDKGLLGTSLSGGNLQKTPKTIWSFALPEGKFLNQSVDGTDEYIRELEIVENYHEINRWKLIDTTYAATSSTTNKTYIGGRDIIKGEGTKWYISVYDSKNTLVNTLSYNLQILFEGPSGHIYIGTNEANGAFLYKIDSNSDKAISKKKFPIESGVLGIHTDGTPFISDEGLYLLIIGYETQGEITEIIFYSFKQDNFTQSLKIEGSYSTIFADGNNLFLSGRGGVVWVDKNSGEIVKRFTGK